MARYDYLIVGCGFAGSVLGLQRGFRVQNPAGLVGIFTADRETNGIEQRHRRDHSTRGVAHDGGRDVVRLEHEVRHGCLHLTRVFPKDDHFIVRHSILQFLVTNGRQGTHPKRTIISVHAARDPSAGARPGKTKGPAVVSRAPGSVRFAD